MFPFTVLCNLLRERQELASQGAFAPGLGPLQQRRQAVCLQIGTVGRVIWEPFRLSVHQTPTRWETRSQRYATLLEL